MFVFNQGLFAASYFERVLTDAGLPRPRPLPDAARRLAELVRIWNDARPQLVREVPAQVAGHPFVGLPNYLVPNESSETAVEQHFVRPVLIEVLGYAVANNQPLAMRGAAAEEDGTRNKRPDMVLFTDVGERDHAVQAASRTKALYDGVAFCRRAAMILDAKKIVKGVGQDEAGLLQGDFLGDLGLPKKQRKGGTAREDIEQVERYLRGFDRKWGVLTNGRSWRLMRRGEVDRHLRFDLVEFVESVRNKPAFEPSDLATFTLFYYLFGPPAAAGGWLDDVERESEASGRQVKDVLRASAHRAVEKIATGFFEHAPNKLDDVGQDRLDHLREVSLTLLYRLLFVMKAEAQNLLPMRDATGSQTPYARMLSTAALFGELDRASESDRARFSHVYDGLVRLFRAVDRGNAQFGIPAYNGGLFDGEQHPDLESWLLIDEALYAVLGDLLYLDAGRQPVPYADLDVRDLGSIYEGLLEQRLTARHAGDRVILELRNQKGERKASGSYFTPDSLVDHLVRRSVVPLLEATGGDAHKALQLKVVDPAMGSGHFLVKVVDVMAGWLTTHCDPVDDGVLGDNGPAELSYWKRKVVEHCVYGVDVNPMAVELARVALWLHTAEFGKPLSFVDHHLRVGNSLVGAELAKIERPGLKAKATKHGPQWEAVASRAKADSDQPTLALPAQESRFAAVVAELAHIMSLPSDSAEHVKEKARAYRKALSSRLEPLRILADLWCAQWFVVEPDADGQIAYFGADGMFARALRACREEDAAARDAQLAELRVDPLVVELKRLRETGYGIRPMAFFHWELEFPDVVFDVGGQRRGGFGFDAVVGNPPWDKLKPERRQFFAPFSRPEAGVDWDVAGAQGASLDRVIGRIEKDTPGLSQRWESYQTTIERMNVFVDQAGRYEWQAPDGGGGGDADLYRVFVELALQLVHLRGRVGQVVPSSLWQSAGCTKLRELLLRRATVHEAWGFENYRRWAFEIDSRFKFTAFVVSGAMPPNEHEIVCGFMLRDTRALDGGNPERVVRLTASDVERLSPDSLALLDFRGAGDAGVAARLHRDFGSMLDAVTHRQLGYRREFDMTMDGWRFRTPDFMRRHGFREVRSLGGADAGSESIASSATARPSTTPPAGGDYWVSADSGWYRARGYVPNLESVGGEKLEVFYEAADAQFVPTTTDRFDRSQFRIIPDCLYVPVYEGRMVHNFDHAQKAYVSGEGRKAVWREIPVTVKSMVPRVFIAIAEQPDAQFRIGFCDVTGATNERTMLAAALPAMARCGHKVPVLRCSNAFEGFAHLAVLNSFVWDWLVRLRVSTSMTLTFVSRVPTPAFSGGALDSRLAELAAALSWTTPEMAEHFAAAAEGRAWAETAPTMNPWRRAELRAEIDAIVAELYGLSVPDFARILTGFPLLDRDQPALDGDLFLTEANEKPKGKQGVSWVATDHGNYDIEPRSFITRDLALLRYMQRRGVAPPRDLHAFYRDEVGLDPDGPLSRFRIGAVRDLIDRVELAKERGAVAYVPSTRGGGGEEE